MANFREPSRLLRLLSEFLVILCLVNGVSVVAKPTTRFRTCHSQEKVDVSCPVLLGEKFKMERKSDNGCHWWLWQPLCCDAIVNHLSRIWVDTDFRKLCKQVQEATPLQERSPPWLSSPIVFYASDTPSLKLGLGGLCCYRNQRVLQVIIIFRARPVAITTSINRHSWSLLFLSLRRLGECPWFGVAFRLDPDLNRLIAKDVENERVQTTSICLSESNFFHRERSIHS